MPTIAEDLLDLGDLDTLIEDDFLELLCEVVIEYDEEAEAFEETKEIPDASKKRRTTLVYNE